MPNLHVYFTSENPSHPESGENIAIVVVVCLVVICSVVLIIARCVYNYRSGHRQQGIFV